MKAKIQIVSISAQCPHCNGDLFDAESGSLYIDVNQHRKGAKFECIDCGQKSELEMKAWK